MTEIHRCPQDGVNNQGESPGPPRRLCSLRETHLNTSRLQVLDLDILLELGWRPAEDHQRTEVQNLDIPERLSNQQQPQLQPQVLQNLFQHTPKNLAKLVNYLAFLRSFLNEKNFISIIERKIQDLHFRYQRKHHAPQIYQVGSVQFGFI